MCRLHSPPFYGSQKKQEKKADGPTAPRPRTVKVRPEQSSPSFMSSFNPARLTIVTFLHASSAMGFMKNELLPQVFLFVYVPENFALAYSPIFADAETKYIYIYKINKKKSRQTPLRGA